jgi:hypothetical protein
MLMLLVEFIVGFLVCMACIVRELERYAKGDGILAKKYRISVLEDQE